MEQLKEEAPITEAPNVEHISVAEVGSNMQEYYDDIPSFPPDVSHIDLAPPGTDLEQIKVIKETQAPDISHIKLES